MEAKNFNDSPELKGKCCERCGDPGTCNCSWDHLLIPTDGGGVICLRCYYGGNDTE